jgi:DNA-binding XRE family transcriptional regulator
MFNGSKVRAFREAKQISRKELGAKIGRSEAYVQSIEAGTKCESINAIKLLCNTLGVNINDLFDDNENNAA